MRATEHVLGRAPDSAERPVIDDVQVTVPWGLRVAWSAGVAIYYNLTFSQAHQDPRRSASLQLRPDIVLCVRSESGEAIHVLDAKLRIDREGSEEIGEERKKSFKWSDLAKMHAYRDALPAVLTAFVIYPGDQATRFAVDGAKPGAVGAIPLAPGNDTEHLVNHVRAVLNGL